MLQFLIRRNRLHTLTTMRSNDAYIGLPHDIFCFSMLQEVLARTLGVALGQYSHFVGSLHLYDENRDEAQQYLDEGVQATIAMPARILIFLVSRTIEPGLIPRGQISFMAAPVIAPVQTAAVIPIAQTPCSRHVVNWVYVMAIIRKIGA
jgi:hypothetical protein